MDTTQMYQMDNFFETIENHSIFTMNGIKPRRNFENLPKLIKKYKCKISEAENKPRFDELPQPKTENEALELIENFWNAQHFDQNIDLPAGDFYSIRWSVPKSLNVIKKHKIKPINFFVKVMSDSIAPGAIERNRLEGAKTNTDPIIAVHYPLLNKTPPFIVIDGNHRLFNKIQSGEEYIKGFLLSPEHQYEALAGELDRTLYKVHYNLGVIIKYMMEEISKNKMKRALLPL